MFDVVIAQCPRCGYQYFSWSEEGAKEKFKEHRCPITLADREVMEILDRICGDNMEYKEWK